MSFMIVKPQGGGQESSRSFKALLLNDMPLLTRTLQKEEKVRQKGWSASKAPDSSWK